jgi:hypothetical protein
MDCNGLKQNMKDKVDQINWWRVAVKALALFVLLNLAFAALPSEGLGRLSLHNWLLPGRERFPFGEDPSRAYNFSLYNLEAMYAAHSVAAAPTGELRVFILGDSSVWGTLLRPAETLPGQLNAAGLTCAGRPLRFYNLGYPTLSLAKDLMLLDRAMRYQPDLVLWLVTLESFPLQRQLDSPIAANNTGRMQALEDNLGLEFGAGALPHPSFWERTIVGQRRALADLARLQLYGVMWAGTGIDQHYPETYTPAQRDLAAEVEYYGFSPEERMQPRDLGFELVSAGQQVLGDIPLLLVNEPILVSAGENSEIRYNFYYPRWAYDDYRQMLEAYAAETGISYLDIWDLVDESHFTNSAIHLDPAGVRQLADALTEHILSEVCEQ